jgi:NAD(P)-dependent dehydrogenase (short-subunit alcohol dehydrogenase family)
MATPILVTGAAGRVGGIGCTVTELLLQHGKAVRAMVRNEDERAQALRDMGAEVVVGDLLDLAAMHRVMAGCETMYFGSAIRSNAGTQRRICNILDNHGFCVILSRPSITRVALPEAEPCCETRRKRAASKPDRQRNGINGGAILSASRMS